MNLRRLPIALAVLTVSIAVARAAEAPAWPGLGKDAPCLKEQWPKARTLVWAKPGEGGTALDAANWTEFAPAGDDQAGKAGKPATAGPDANTDLVLPDAPAGQSYTVGFMVCTQYPGPLWPPTLSCRHLTIGSGAALDGGVGFARGQLVQGTWPAHDRAAAICGNVTVRDGGSLFGHLYFLGDRHTWFHVGRSPEPLVRDIVVRKEKGASVTFMSHEYDLVDGVAVESGRLVLAPGANLRINATSQVRIDLKKVRNFDSWQFEPYVRVHKGAALEMQAGSRIGRVKAPAEIGPDMRIEGLLQIGQAGQSGGAPAVIELTNAEGDGKYLNQAGGLYIQPTAEVRNFGTLCITATDPNAAATKGVSVFLEGPVDFGRVNIDCLRAGGIAATDLTAAKRALAAATFGKHCATTGDAIYSKLDLMDFKGGFGTVEFVDGLKTECEILFPLGDRLIVRSKGNRISQSFNLKSIHSITIAGKTTEYHPSRALPAQEQELRKVNALWGDVPGKGQIGNYGKQEWPKAPLMVWRRPGETGSRYVASNWLDDQGRPYLELPISDNAGAPGAVSSSLGDPSSPEVDILLPASDEFYQVVGERGEWRCRHVTIENNAYFCLCFDICGNVWMKDGSRMQASWFGKYCNKTPNLNRFLRFDGMRIERPNRPGEAPRREPDLSISQWGVYETGPGGTLEVVGLNQITDQFHVDGKGTTIISENSYLAPGQRVAFVIQPEATVVLLQDARIGYEAAMQQRGTAAVLVNGTLMIGTPERPITRDMLFPMAGIEKGMINRQAAGHARTAGVSLLVTEQGRLIMHSADPTKARVIFKMYDTEKAKERGKKYGNPDGIALDFAGKADLNGVVFDNVLEGGLMVSPEQRATWKNVFYGEHNLAAPEKLYYGPKN